MTTWSKEPPKEPGFYWIRWAWWRSETIEIAFVYDDDDGVLRVSRMGQRDDARVVASDCMWNGPITPPSEEKP